MKYKTLLLDNILSLLKQIHSRSSTKFISKDFIIRHCSNFDKDIIVAHLNILKDQGLINSSTGYGNNSDAFRISSEGILKISNGGFSKDAEQQQKKNLNDEKMFELQIQNLQGQINDINKRRTFWDSSARANKYFWIPIVLSFAALAISIYVAFF